MSTTFVASTQLTTINCGKCGGIYAIQERYRQHKSEKSGSWHCPYCETCWGYAKGENQRLREELESERSRLASSRASHDQTRAALRDTEKSLVAQKGVTTRIKNRVKNGVCPCCNRTFANLAAHMKGQHPDYANHKDPTHAQ